MRQSSIIAVLAVILAGMSLAVPVGAQTIMMVGTAHLARLLVYWEVAFEMRREIVDKRLG